MYCAQMFLSIAKTCVWGVLPSHRLESEWVIRTHAATYQRKLSYGWCTHTCYNLSQKTKLWVIYAYATTYHRKLSWSLAHGSRQGNCLPLQYTLLSYCCPWSHYQGWQFFLWFILVAFLFVCASQNPIHFFIEINCHTYVYACFILALALD